MKKKTCTTESCEDSVVIYENGTLETFTRGTKSALYRGKDAEAARKSLEMSDDDWSRLLVSDAEEE